MDYHMIALIAFGANIAVGMLTVLVTYAGMERSILTGACTALATSSIALLVERHLGQYLIWPNWAALRMTIIIGILGAVTGVTMALLVWRPELQSDSTPT